MSILNLLSISKNIADLNKNLREVIRIEKEKEENNLIDFILKKEQRDSYDENTKEVQTIKGLNFEINSYEKGPLDYKNHDTYYCQYKDWVFIIKYYNDPDIEEGILALYNPINIKTKKVIEYYCDLWCNNTSREKLEDLIFLLDNGLEAFINKKYSFVNKLPDLLKDKGLEVISENYSFAPYTYNGYLKVILNDDKFIKKSCILKIKNVSSDGATIILQEKENNFYDYFQKKYSFIYNGEEDIEELIKCITCFIEEINGLYGFYENGKFYQGKDIDMLIEEMKDKVKKNYYEDYNCHKVNINNSLINKAREEDHYKGIDIYREFTIVFDNCYHENEKTIRQTFNITFKYDKNTDENNCLLNIELNTRNLIDCSYNLPHKEKVEMKGQFLHLYGILKFFLCCLFENNGYPLYEDCMNFKK